MKIILEIIINNQKNTFSYRFFTFTGVTSSVSSFIFEVIYCSFYFKKFLHYYLEEFS
jgi:hypothetical protein